MKEKRERVTCVIICVCGCAYLAACPTCAFSFTPTCMRARTTSAACTSPVVASTYTCSLLEPTTSSKADISFSCACGMFVCVYARTCVRMKRKGEQIHTHTQPIRHRHSEQHTHTSARAHTHTQIPVYTHNRDMYVDIYMI